MDNETIMTNNKETLTRLQTYIYKTQELKEKQAKKDTKNGGKR